MRYDLELLKDSIDIHLHAGPSFFPRLMDAQETAEVAKASGMRGIVIKHHHTPTVERGYFVQKAVPGLEVYGGITLNYSSGGTESLCSGLNPQFRGKNCLDAYC